MTERRSKIQSVFVGGLALLAFLFFGFLYANHLHFKEQNLLFLITSDQLLSYLQRPACLATLVGDFLTQFFYLPLGGATVLCLLFVLEWLVVRSLVKRTSQSVNASLWALLVPVTDCGLHVLQLHSVGVSVAVLLALLALLMYSEIENVWASWGFAMVCSLFGFWTLGSSVILFPVMFLFLSKHALKHEIIKLGAVAVTVLAVFAVSPSFFMLDRWSMVLYPIQNQWSGLLLLAATGAVVFPFLIRKNEFQHKNLVAIGLCVLLPIYLVLIVLKLANFRFEKLLQLDSDFNASKPEKVIERVQRNGFQSRNESYYVNMALAQQGLLPERLLEFYQPFTHALLLPVLPTESWQSIVVSNEAFYLVGDMNMAQHSAMLAMTFSPNQRSARIVRRLAEINMVNHDKPAATKYLRMLQKTLFHRSWANARLAELQQNLEPEWLAFKRSQIPEKDTIWKSQDYLQSLEFLVKNNPNNIMALDYLLCGHLLSKNLSDFMRLYNKYSVAIQRPIPKAYSEALLISLFAQKAHSAEIEGYGISAETTAAFVEYTNRFAQVQGDGNWLKTDFGQTYWFYYHFAKMNLRE